MIVKKQLLGRIVLLSLILGIFGLNIIALSIDKIIDTQKEDDNNNVNLIKDPEKIINDQGTYQVIHTQEWLKDNGFTLPASSWKNTTTGTDRTDLKASLTDGAANYEVLGEQYTYDSINGTPITAKGWTRTKDWYYPSYPNQLATMNNFGVHARHYWAEGADQQVAVVYKKNIIMTRNMSDYVITSASLNMTINGTVEAYTGADGCTPTGQGVEVTGDYTSATQYSGASPAQYSHGDFARYYINIGAYNRVKNYTDVITYQNATLGKDSVGVGNDKMYNNILIADQNDLIFILNNLFHTYNNYNLTIYIGIFINCEDNFPSDDDNFEDLWINKVNLRFTYKKNINQATSLSWYQTGNKITGSNVAIANATLNFQYKTNYTWPSASQNSELRLVINNTQHSETVKLSSASTSFSPAKTNGFDVGYLIKKAFDSNGNISLSILLYIADTFTLERKIKISIDNVSLIITYIETKNEEATSKVLLLNGIDRTGPNSLQLPVGDQLNLTVLYKNSTGNKIPGATVQLTGYGAPKFLSEHATLHQYNITINTTLLSMGENYFIIKAEKLYHEKQEFVVTITLNPREFYFDTILLNNTEQTNIELEWNDLLKLNVTLNDTVSNIFVSGATVKVTGPSYLKTFTENVGLKKFDLTVNTTELKLGINFLTLSAEKVNYTLLSTILTITVNLRSTNLIVYLNGTNANSIQLYNMSIGQSVNISASFKDKNMAFILQATVELSGEITETLEPQPAISRYVKIKTADSIGVGVKFLTVSANKSNYVSGSVVLKIKITERNTELNLFLNGQNKTSEKYVSAEVGKIVNVTVTYKDAITKELLVGIVNLIGNGTSLALYKNGTNYYNISIDTKGLGQGINFYTIYAEKTNYQPQSILFTIEVVEKQTTLNLFLNKTDKTLDRSIKITVGQTVNITAVYRDIDGNFLPSATIEIFGGLVSDNLTKHAMYDQFNITIFPADLEYGVNFLTLYAHQANYEPQTMLIKIEIIDKQTKLDLFLDTYNRTLERAVQVIWGNQLNITVTYKELESGQHISTQNVTLIGLGPIRKLTEVASNRYTIMLNSSIYLQLGIKYLTVYATLSVYQPQSIIFRVEVIERATSLDLFLNNETVSYLKIIHGEQINITIKYLDTISDPDLFVRDATVQVTGAPIPLILQGYSQLKQYTIVFNSADLQLGIKYLVLTAQRANYTSQTITFNIEVIKRNTTLQLYLNSVDLTIVKSLEIRWNENINITIKYKDTDLIPSDHITDATVFLTGAGSPISLLEYIALKQYNKTINSAILKLGLNSLIISAERSNYTITSITFNIKVLARPTSLNVFLNGENKTKDKEIELAIRSTINITISYKDGTTKQHISSASIQLTGESLPALTWDEDSIFKQYSVTIDTNDLDIGVRYLAIYATKDNYTEATITLKISVKRIPTEISTEDGEDVINLKPGDMYKLKITLKDLYFGGKISGATVTFTSNIVQEGLREGELEETEDGVYEFSFENMPEGTYVVTISVIADDDYEFKRFEITFNVVRPQEDVLAFQVITGVSIAAAIAVGGYFIAYQKVFKYPKSVRKIHSYKKTMKKAKSPDVEIPQRENAIQSLYSSELAKTSKFFKGKLKQPTQEQKPSDKFSKAQEAGKINKESSDLKQAPKP